METGKKVAAEFAVDKHIKPLLLDSSDQAISRPLVIGIGSGSTIVYAVQRIRGLWDSEVPVIVKHNTRFIPTSHQSKMLLIESRLPVTDCWQCQSVELTIDGADEVDNKLNCIKGGGGCHLEEKLVASISKTLVLIADESKISPSGCLGDAWKKGIPLEVVPIACLPVLEALKTFAGYSHAQLRTGSGKAGPVVTDNGNMIIDVHFERASLVSDKLEELNTRLKCLVGVVETGLFVGMAKFAYFGTSNGQVLIKQV